MDDRPIRITGNIDPSDLPARIIGTIPEKDASLRPVRITGNIPVGLGSSVVNESGGDEDLTARLYKSDCKSSSL